MPMDRCGKKQQVGIKTRWQKRNQFLTASTPCTRQRMMTTVLLQIGLISYCHAGRESVQFCGFEKGLSWPVCFQGRKNKETEIWCSPLRWLWHRKILMLVSVLVSQLNSLSEDLYLFGCAGSAVPVAALALCFLKSRKSVFTTLDYISPLLLMLLVQMRKQCWSWTRQWWLLSEGLLDCNKEFFFPSNSSMTSTVCCCMEAMAARTFPEVKFSNIRSTKYLHLRLSAVWL